MKTKKVIRLIVLIQIILFTACEKQEVLQLDENAGNFQIEENTDSFQLEALTVNDIPDVVNKVLKSTPNSNVLLKSANGSGNNDNLILDDSWILAATDSIGNTSYSLRAYIPETPYNVFYNILVKKTYEGSLNQPYLLRYEVDEEYWLTYATSHRKDAAFQGNIEVYAVNSIDIPSLSRSNGNNNTEPCFGVTVTSGSNGSGGNGNSGGGNSNCSGRVGTPGFSSNAGSNYSLAGVVSASGGSGTKPYVEVGKGDFVEDFNQKSRFPSKQAQYLSTSRSGSNGECPEDQVLVPINEEELIVTFSPDKPIADMNEFLECFDVSKEASFSIFVDEPSPGSGDTWTTSWNGIKPVAVVGYTFISISQGGNVSTFGFYPKGEDVSPRNPKDLAAFGNDGGEKFSASLSTNITASQLKKIIDLAVKNSSDYHLDNFNCTDFALKAANISGFNLSSCDGLWPGGGGSNPGTLGSEIRNKSLKNGQSKNTTGGKAPANKKKC